MGLIIGLSKVQGKYTIFVVVDRLTKFAFFFSHIHRVQRITSGRFIFEGALEVAWASKEYCE